MYKLLALDLDDTTLNSNHEVLPVVHEAIARAKSAGTRVIAATGRSYRGCRHILDKAGLFGTCMAFGGAMIADHPSGEIIDAVPIPRDVALEVADFAKGKGLYILIFDGQDYYFEQPSKFSERYAKANHFAGIQAPFASLPLECVLKCLICDDERIEEIRPEAERLFAGKCSVVKSRPFFLEFNENGVTKGTALRKLAENWGIDRSEVIAMGDNYNDLDMIEYAGLGVAVANGEEDLKALANYVSPSSDKGAVAHVINKFILGE